MAQGQEIRVPDIGDTDDVSVIEVLVAVGDRVEVDQSLVTLESDKASMEVPATHAGTVAELRVKIGDSVEEGSVLAVIEGAADDATTSDVSAPASPAPASPATAPPVAAASEPAPSTGAASADASSSGPPSSSDTPAVSVDETAFAGAYASPSVRRLARELGVDLGAIPGTGRKGRITRDDVAGFVKQALAGAGAANTGAAGGALPAMPEIDFSQFGPVEVVPLSRIRQRSAKNLHRSWLHVPHVTQFENADITEMEAFRKAHNAEVAKRGVGTKVSPVAFALKAAASSLRAFPDVNASLGADGTTLVRKQYVHIGVAVDTADGLIVPVVRDADQKGLEALAAELSDLARRARDRKLLPADLKGASFTISSLGGIGGTAFTPIVNAPEVAILGLSRSSMQPVWQGTEFGPRLILPLSLSYDHRVVDGALAARFIVHLRDRFEDLRRMLL